MFFFRRLHSSTPSYFIPRLSANVRLLQMAGIILEPGRTVGRSVDQFILASVNPFRIGADRILLLSFVPVRYLLQLIVILALSAVQNVRGSTRGTICTGATITRHSVVPAVQPPELPTATENPPPTPAAGLVVHARDREALTQAPFVG